MKRGPKAIVLAILVLGCTSAPPIATSNLTPTALQPSPTASPAPTSPPVTPTPSPSPTPTPIPVPPETNAYDGVWASDVVTRDDFTAALTRNGLDASKTTAIAGDPKVLDWLFEIDIDSGTWTENEVDNGVPVGTGWSGKFGATDADTVVAIDDNAGCPITYDVKRDGDSLTVDVVDDQCPPFDGLPDELIQTAIFESSPFHLVQAADWSAPAATARPTLPASFVPATPLVSTSLTRQTLHPIGTVPGADLGYIEYLPPNYGDEPSPLIVFLHGSGESGDGSPGQLSHVAGAGLQSLIAGNHWPDDRPFVVLSPQHNEAAPDWCFTSDEIDSFLKFALDHYNVDPTRVYLTGLSCGAIGMWGYLGDHANEIVAAAVPIAGYGITAIAKQGCKLAALPIWAFHGAQDPNVAVYGDVYPLTVIQACHDPEPADARLTVDPSGFHDVWSATYSGHNGADIYDWLLSHHK